VSGADWVWGGLVAAGAGFEAYALANARAGDTLSETTRRLFRTRHPVGALAFHGGLARLRGLVPVHIID
jgi:hypothetical protein